MGQKHGSVIDFPDGTSQSTAANPKVILPRAKPSGGSALLSVPNELWINSQNRSMNTGLVYYQSLTINSPISVAGFYVEVQAAVAGSTCRPAIYNSDLDWQPTGIVVDAGPIDCSAVGTTGATLASPQTLAAGNYLIALMLSSSSLTFIAQRSGSSRAGMSRALGTSRYIIEWRGTQAYGAFPTTGTKWDTAVTSTTLGFMYPVQLDWSPA